MRRFFLVWRERLEIFQQPTEKSVSSEIHQQPAVKLSGSEISEKPSRKLAASEISQQHAGKFAPSKIFQKASEKLAIWQKPSAKSDQPFTLGWSHYVELLPIKNPDERSFYEIEAA